MSRRPDYRIHSEIGTHPTRKVTLRPPSHWDISCQTFEAAGSEQAPRAKEIKVVLWAQVRNVPSTLTNVCLSVKSSSGKWLCILILVEDHSDCLPNSCPENSYCSGVNDNGEPLCSCQRGFHNIGTESSPQCQGQKCLFHLIICMSCGDFVRRMVLLWCFNHTLTNEPCTINTVVHQLSLSFQLWALILYLSC